MTTHDLVVRNGTLIDDAGKAVTPGFIDARTPDM